MKESLSIIRVNQKHFQRKEGKIMTILETRDLCKYYGSGESEVKAVDRVNVKIEQGEFVAIVGKSGSGKSTLLHMLGGLDHPTSGKVYINGKDIYEFKEEELAIFRRRRIGFIFQAYNLIPSLNVWENIILPIGLDSSKVDEEFVEDIIGTLDIKDKKRIFLIHCQEDSSKGQQSQEH